MIPFWKGFEKQGSVRGPIKRHVLVLYWSDENGEIKERFSKLRLKHPTVKVKLVNAKKENTKLMAHKILKLPTILLLKDGREVDRLEEVGSPTILEQLFRRAKT